MSKFTAGSAVPALDWDFTKFQPPTDPPGPAWRGTIPEPSQGAIETFQKTVRGMSPTGDPTRLGEVEGTDVLSGLKEALGILCRGQPTEAMLDALPYRVLVAFVSWVTGQLANPQ